MVSTSRSLTVTRSTRIRQSSSRRAGVATAIASGRASSRARYASNERIRIVVRQRGKRRPDGIPLGLVVGVAEVSPAMLLLQSFQAGEEAFALLAGDRDLGGFEPTTQLVSGRIDGRTRQDRLGDRGQDLSLDELGR